jgi:hypothetical protein
VTTQAHVQCDQECESGGFASARVSHVRVSHICTIQLPRPGQYQHGNDGHVCRCTILTVVGAAGSSAWSPPCVLSDAWPVEVLWDAPGDLDVV